MLFGQDQDDVIMAPCATDAKKDFVHYLFSEYLCHSAWMQLDLTPRIHGNIPDPARIPIG